MGRIVQRIPFPHQSFGPFISCLKDYFNDVVHPFEYIVVGTYQKAIQLIEQHKNIDTLTKHGTSAPVLVFTPQLTEPVTPLDFDWKYSNLSPFMAKYNQKPIFEYEDNIFSIVTRRMSGTVDFKIFTASMMEMHDIYLDVLDAFRGLNRITIMSLVKQYLVISDTIRLYEDDHERLAINWEDTTMKDIYFPGINKDKFYIPMKTIPFMTLQSVSDSSAFFGGDGLPEYSLQGSLTYELEVPVLIVLETQIALNGIDVDIGTTYAPDVTDEANHPGLEDSDHNPIIPGDDGDVIIGPTDGYGDPKYPNQKGFVGISGDEDSQMINIMFVDRQMDDDTIKTEVGRVLKEYRVEVVVDNTTLSYPYIIPDIPWVVTKENTLIYIKNKYQVNWEVEDENSVRMLDGETYTNTTFEITLFQFKEMVCGKGGIR